MLNVKRMKGNQAGFTLVEIAIVMVIIGLLIGGVLKGQAMINSAKVKRVVKQADEFRAMTMAFYDKYGVYPGDENVANVPPGDAVNGNGSGQMEFAERFDFFNDLMEAKLIAGSFTGANVATHAFGDDTFVYWADPPGAPGADHYIRFDNLPWDVCLEIDTKYDDGVFNTGTIVANEDYIEAATPVANFYMPF
jgi:prepilin-type N-terminal cleavage/methylation domain-containing protein